MTSRVIYQGQLRTQAEHVRSGKTIVSDAPTDNHGLGEAFSPTDLVATALASCMLTVMGIKAESMDLDLSGMTAEVTKTMQSGPRRIAKVEVIVDMPERNYSKLDRALLERTARTCPVARSLADATKQEITFRWKTDSASEE